MEDGDVLECILGRLKLLPEQIFQGRDLFHVFAEPSAKSGKGNTVLHLLLEQNDVNSVRSELHLDCLKAGCDPYLKNKENKTFFEKSGVQIDFLETVKDSFNDWANGKRSVWNSNTGEYCILKEFTNHGGSSKIL